MTFRAQVQAVLTERGLTNKFKLQFKDGCRHDVLTVTLLEWDKLKTDLYEVVRQDLKRRLLPVRVTLYVRGKDIVGNHFDSSGNAGYIFV